jgi:hypothetical protein
MEKYLIVIMSVLVILFNSYYNTLTSETSTEGYSNFTLEQADGKVPEAQTRVLVQETYPITGKKGISNNGASDIWWWYPTFTVGSYDQITNNIKYPERPSNGTCMPASMCGALYKETKNYAGKNYIYPLPPVSKCGTRIGYFSSPVGNLNV